MSTYHLQIVTPDGKHYDGPAEKVIVRTVQGEVCVLARHMDYVTPLGMGEARITIDGAVRRAACIGGVLTVAGDTVRIIATTFEWAEDIDLDRAQGAYRKAKAALEGELTENDRTILDSRLKRSMIRIKVASGSSEMPA